MLGDSLGVGLGDGLRVVLSDGVGVGVSDVVSDGLGVVLSVGVCDSVVVVGSSVGLGGVYDQESPTPLVVP